MSQAAQKSIPDRIIQHFARRNYDILGELGRGGMGVVYLALHKKLGRKVAIKTLSPDRATRENSSRRFEREARTFAEVHHPNIATLFEYDDEGPVQYLALEYVDGYDLESERRRGRDWDAHDAAQIIAKVAAALDYTHEKGILHRDIKPGNILIERATGRVVLTDFGLAKGRKDETLTATGFAVGTPAYMAPEQISDHFGVRPDGRSDIFSLGVVFYEMLTNKHPFLGADDLKTMRAIVHNEVVPMRDHNPKIPAELDRIVKRMLEKHPNDRYATAGELAKELEDFLAGKSLPPPVAPRAPQPAAPSAAPAAVPSTPLASNNPATSATPIAPAPSTAFLGLSNKMLIALAVVLVLVLAVLMLLAGIVIGQMGR